MSADGNDKKAGGDGSGGSWNEIARQAAEKRHSRNVGELKGQIAALLEEQASLRRQVEALVEVGQAEPQPLIIRAKAGRGKKPDKSLAAAVAIASDWHVEETVDPKTVNGLNEYSLEIASQRVERFFRGVVKLTEIERGGAEIKDLVLFLGGDLMTGYIHEELEESNGLSPVETLLWLYERISGGLEYLSREGGYERIVIPCCHGNHGRTTKKMRVATSARNSYEWLLYKFLEKTLPQYEWRIADGYFVYAEIYGRVLRFHHGDGIQYQGGIGGLTIPTEKKIASWNKGRVADLDLFGHYHQYQQNPKWCSNGSLIGYGPYSIRVGAGFEPPQQTFFLLDETRGRTGTWPIFCES